MYGGIKGTQLGQLSQRVHEHDNDKFPNACLIMSLDVLFCLLFKIAFVHALVVGLIVYLYIGPFTLLKLARLRSVVLVSV